MEHDALLPLMNTVNAPLELCEQVKDRFLQFLNNYVVTDSLDAEPSQSITHSQGSGGAGAGGRPPAPPSSTRQPGRLPRGDQPPRRPPTARRPV